ncbi:Serine/threonine-protein kinase D3, partial [Fragariocoptes setiger]
LANQLSAFGVRVSKTLVPFGPVLMLSSTSVRPRKKAAKNKHEIKTRPQIENNRNSSDKASLPNLTGVGQFFRALKMKDEPHSTSTLLDTTIAHGANNGNNGNSSSNNNNGNSSAASSTSNSGTGNGMASDGTSTASSHAELNFIQTKTNANSSSNRTSNNNNNKGPSQQQQSNGLSGYTTSISLDALGKLNSLAIQSPPSATSTFNPSPDPEDGVIKFHLKTSIFKKTITTDRYSMTLGSLKQYSIDFINELFPNHCIEDLQAQLILRIYDPVDESFTPFNAVSDINHNAYVVVELSEKCPTQLVSGQRGCPQKNPHLFKEHTYLRPTDCDQCNKMILGIYKQGWRCERCMKNFCKKCEQTKGNEGCLRPSPPASSGGMPPCRPVHRLVQSVRNVRRHDHNKTIKEGWLQYHIDSNVQGHHFWRLNETDLTLYKDQTSQRFFKSIPVTQIKRVLSSSEVPNAWSQLSPRSRTSTNHSTYGITNEHHSNINFSQAFAFEITAGTFYVVEAESREEAQDWRNRINQALNQVKQEEQVQQQQQKPIEAPQAQSGNSVQVKNELTNLAPPCDNIVNDPSQNSNNNGETKRRFHVSPRVSPRRAQTRMSRLKNRRQISIEVPKNDIPEHLVEMHYLIAKDEKGEGKHILGLGQFGRVYAAIGHFKPMGNDKYRGVPVAIKEILKTRFQAAQQEQLRNEAEILKQLDHPGVIILEDFYDLDTKIYIVMERLENDMLELILSSEGSKLTERLTKFLIYQILAALRYLHSKNFAHCDLKPENVLLVSNSEFPQIKLCDFGFAKIIDENTFRQSLVGTPAYLAPEVVHQNKYNKALDLWSSGVIVYVSLSGTFPFNNNAPIEKQISELDEFYPKDPWSTISTDAKEFINRLLTIEPERRPSAASAQQHQWLNDFQLWCDLIELECQLRLERTWTDKADYLRWSKYASENGKTVPKYAIDTYGDHQTSRELA